MQLWRWLVDTVPRSRRWWWALLGVNAVGSVYGFLWYQDQLRATAPWQWPVVPDSPGSTLLFACFLLALLSGRRPGWLAALALVSLMKYGLWTALVLPYNVVVLGSALRFDDVHLTLSHFGMWVQGLIFARVYPPPLGWALAAWGWLYLQDYVDYVHGLHPALPSAELFGPAAAIAVGLSTVWGAVLTWLALRHRSGGAAAG